MLEINKKDPSTSWTKKTLKSVQWSDLLQRKGCKSRHKNTQQTSHSNTCHSQKQMSSCFRNPVKKTFPNISLSHQLLPWFHYWRSLLQPFQFGQHQWCQPYDVAKLQLEMTAVSGVSQLRDLPCHADPLSLFLHFAFLPIMSKPRSPFSSKLQRLSETRLLDYEKFMLKSMIS